MGFLLSLSLAAAADSLVAFRVEGGTAIAEPLTGKRGDPVEGARIAAGRTQGNCLACHALPMPEEKLQGDVGPDLKGVASRLGEGELRLRVVNPKLVNPETAMPAYYRVDGLYRVRKDLVGKPILTAEQVEDVVAYLATLKE
ncbi:MAG: sulfur oxidation c-type cytochrome SoxX [Alphaproteobacteria bacterium]|nr:sulfur oxidation c-type cytochrome SoxX [Alphaproteobacteria bacterium]